MLRPGGVAVHNTVNRYTIAPEVHVGLWGLGFLPRSWQVRYVRWRRGAAYEIRPLSRAQLGGIARAAFGKVDFELGDIEDDALATLPPGKQVQVRLYRKLKRLPPAKQLLGWLGPEWDVVMGDPRRSAAPG